jgi:hypothetical protein
MDAAVDGITSPMFGAADLAEFLAFRLRQLPSEGVAMLSGCAGGAKSF